MPLRTDPSWAWLDAGDQAALVARGEATPADLVAAARERIERIDGQLGAVPIRLFTEAGRSVARVPAGAAWAGVPFLLKDVGARQAGLPYYAANRALRDADYRAPEDTQLGLRFRELGLVTLGKSSTPEFGLQSYTWPLVYGPVRNPWDPGRTAGGSSGGACAAVAAGLVPVAHASDGAGSIRIPAAWCGLVGLKPSRDRVAWRHSGEELPDVEFVVARSLRDTATFLDALRPLESRGREPARFAQALGEKPEALRVALCTRSPAGTPVHPTCAAAASQAARRLEAAGHRVDEAAPPDLFEYEERSAWGGLLGGERFRQCLVELAQRLGRPVQPEDVEPFLWTLATEVGERIAPADLERAARWERGWTGRMLAWFEGYDVLVTPTVHEPAPELARLDPRELGPYELLERMVPHMAFTEPWNSTGQPAITLPLAWTDQGLPVGVQLVGAPGREDYLLALSAILLAGSPERAPRIHA